MATTRKNKDFNPNNCPITHCLNKIGGKWKIMIIYAEMPPRVEYRVTTYGLSLLPVISVMQAWGLKDLKK